MTLIKLNKHQVYNYIADHPEWFKNKYNVKVLGEEKYLTCSSIEYHINQELRKGFDDICEADYIVLRGATLTAMVHDGVLERWYSDECHCYKYLPIQPIKEEYRTE